jgi:hypothetical protein
MLVSREPSATTRPLQRYRFSGRFCGDGDICFGGLGYEEAEVPKPATPWHASSCGQRTGARANPAAADGALQ